MKSQALKLKSNSEKTDGSMTLAIVNCAKKNPKSAYDLTICLYTMEVYDKALDVLSTVDSKASDFLKLEIYYESGQYMNTMTHTNQLLEKYAIDAEAILTVIYTRAKCLWKLGKKHKAKSFMSKLVCQKADFRDAQSILFKWNKKVES